MSPCIVEGCTNRVHGLGLCMAHYEQFRRQGRILPRPLRTYARYNGAACRVEGCTRTATDLGYCGAHYSRVRAHGDPRAHIPIRQTRHAGRD